MQSRRLAGRVAEVGSLTASRVMKKWALILTASCVILMMVGFPGLYDSRTRAEAFRHYRDDQSETTVKELQDAKASDRQHILIYELVFGGVLTMLWFVLLRTEKNAYENVVESVAVHRRPAGQSGAAGEFQHDD